MLRLSFAVAAVSLGVAAVSQGALVHRYSFNSNVNDSVGGAHGTIVDAGDSNVNYVDGKLDLSSNFGYNYSFNQSDAYVSLPGPIINNAFTGGVEGEMTVEIWAQASVNRTWAALFSAGSSLAPSLDKSAYLQYIPHAEWQNGPFRITSSSGFSSEKYVDRPADMSTSEPTHLVVAYHLTRIRPFPGSRYAGGFSVYMNGTLIGAVEYDSGLQIDQLVSDRTWLGRSQFDADPIFDGIYDEVRIYNSRLTAADVARNYQLGPNAIPEPSTACLALISLVGIAYRHRARACRSAVEATAPRRPTASSAPAYP